MIKGIFTLMVMASAMIFCTTEQSLPEKDIVDGQLTDDNHHMKSPEANYTEYCASCHGADARAFADRGKWVYGNDQASIAKVIVEGLEDQGMPAFDVTFSDEETQALAAFIVNAKQYVDTYDFGDAFDESQTWEYNGSRYKLELVTDAVEIPWGMAMSPAGTMIYTDREGTLRRRAADGTVTKITNAPEVRPVGQGGLMDVLLAPDFDNSGELYLTYSKYNPDNRDEGTTALYSAKLQGDALIDGKDIWVAMPYYSTQYHFGSRVVWDNDGHLLVSVGDRGKRDINPQDLSLYPGKIHRINADGTIPTDNPYVSSAGAVASIWSHGHRNPQGMAYDAASGTLYENEHGPRGGDEINIITPGLNYGWPVISYGINYSGTIFTEKTAEVGMEQPKHYWVPAIGVCGMAYVSSDMYPDWKGNLLSGSLKYKYLNLNRIKGDDMSQEERLFPGVGRLRSVIQGADGYIYVGVEDPGRIYRVLPQ